ncbi:MAG: hypothetical protein KAI59_05360 [Planctomycetes bacterium]|nr:hypothetical protein [Planctomycetota bacterium]
MLSFSNDADVLKYEPILFGRLYPSSQVLLTGTEAELTGTTFVASDADFTAAKIAAGNVVYLQSVDGKLDMAVEVVSVDSATQLTVSVLRASSDCEPIAPPPATDVTYRISTFAPQANEVAFQLTEHFSIQPGNPTSEYGAENIIDTDVLRQTSTFATISTAYAMVASKDADEIFWKKSLYYQKLFEKARKRCRVSIDTGSDGVSDITMMGSSVRMLRD